jgi:nifR3 family TIM-barrel protein
MSHAERIRRYFSVCPLLPAPMCSYTDRPFRDLLRLLGAHLIYTEMYCSEAIVRGDPKTWSLMDYRGESGPVAVQIFGSRPDLMAESARIAERWGAHVVDLNLGCPAKKIVRGGCGSALAEDPKSALAIVRAMRKVLRVPFTVKMRWQPDGQSLELARACEAEGVDAVALHARTRAQGYSGVANWDWIARLKDTVNIPVVGNGDVRSVADARRMLARTGCDAVMVGRGMVGNPWLFQEAAEARLQTGKREISPEEESQEREDAAHSSVTAPPVFSQSAIAGEPEGGDGATGETEEADEAVCDLEAEVSSLNASLPGCAERLRVLFLHAQLMFRHRGPKGLVEFRKHCACYIRGLHGARQARPELMQVTTLDELCEKLTAHFGSFEACWLGD